MTVRRVLFDPQWSPRRPRLLKSPQSLQNWQDATARVATASRHLSSSTNSASDSNTGSKSETSNKSSSGGVGGLAASGSTSTTRGGGEGPTPAAASAASVADATSTSGARDATKRTVPRIGGLHDFILRTRVLALWRDILRATRDIENPAERKGLRDWARQEFQRNRSVRDSVQIRYLISSGRRDLEQMSRYTSY